MILMFLTESRVSFAEVYWGLKSTLSNFLLACFICLIIHLGRCSEFCFIRSLLPLFGLPTFSRSPLVWIWFTVMGISMSNSSCFSPSTSLYYKIALNILTHEISDSQMMKYWFIFLKNLHGKFESHFDVLIKFLITVSKKISRNFP